MSHIAPRVGVTCRRAAAVVMLALAAQGTEAWGQVGTRPAPPDAAAAAAAETPFLDENATAMERMMAGMDVRPTGDVDRDFVAMMAPHHQGAIDMAMAYLRYGRNPQLRRIAQGIIVEQQQEIAAMSLAIGAPLQPVPHPAGITPQPGTTAAGRAATGGHRHDPLAEAGR